MKKRIFFISIFLNVMFLTTPFTFALDGQPVYTLIRRDLSQVSEIKVFGVDHTKVDESCLKKQDSCEALKAYLKKPVASKEKKSSLSGHPASQHCSAIGGKVLILMDAEKNQYNYCQFSDNTMVSYWDLYEKYRAGQKK